MGARQKLNASYAGGSLIVAALVGCLTESWFAFFAGLIVLLGINLYLGEIRPRR
jgi:hypothetical protein